MKYLNSLIFIVAVLNSFICSSAEYKVSSMANGMSCILDKTGDMVQNTSYHHIWPNENKGLPLKVMRIKSIGGNIIPLFGYITPDGKEIIPVEYDNATNFNAHGYAAVGKLIYDGGTQSPRRMVYYIIDSKGNSIGYKFDFVSETYGDKVMVGIMRKFKSPFDSHDIYAMDYTYLDSDLGKIDSSQRIKLYSSATSFENGVAAVSTDVFGEKKFLINESLDSIGVYDGRKFQLNKGDSDLSFGWASKYPLKVYNYDGYNVIKDTISGSLIQPDILLYKHPSNPLNPDAITFVYEHGLVGAIDTYGNSLAPQYKDLKLVADSIFAYKNDSDWGLLRLDGSLICSPCYRYIYNGFDGEAIVKDSAFNESVINNKGELLYPLQKGSLTDITPKQWKWIVKRGIYEQSHYDKHGTFYNLLGVRLLEDTLSFSKINFNPTTDVMDAITVSGDTVRISHHGTVIQDYHDSYRFSSCIHLRNCPPNEEYEYYALTNDLGKVAIMKVDLITATRTLITDFEYNVDEIKPDVKHNCICLIKDGLYGYINCSGKEVIPFKYEHAYDFDLNCAIARVKHNGKYGFIDIQGTEIIPCNYDYCDRIFDDNLCKIYQHGKVGLLNPKGKEVLPCEYDNFGFPCRYGNQIYIVAYKGDKRYVYNSKGKLLVKYPLDDVTFRINNVIVAKKDDLWGFISPGKKPQFLYSEIGFNCNNLLSVKKDDKWGFVDKKGQLVIPCIYDEVVHAFWNGLAIVCKGTDRVVIDEDAEIINNPYRINPILERQKRIDAGYSVY